MDEKKRRGDESLGDGRGLTLGIGAGQLLLHPVSEPVDRSVQIEDFPKQSAENNGQNGNERVLPLECATDADVRGAERQPLHDDLLQPLPERIAAFGAAEGKPADAPAEEKPHGGAGKNGGGIDD